MDDLLQNSYMISNARFGYTKFMKMPLYNLKCVKHGIECHQNQCYMNIDLEFDKISIYMLYPDDGLT